MIFLLVPEAATQKHLEILSEIAELLSDAEFARQFAGRPRGGQSPPAGCKLAVCTRQSMKPSGISADVLFEDHRESLRWQWVAGLGASERRFDDLAVRAARSGADLVGYLNYIHPYRVQVIGEREVAYLAKSTVEDCARRIARIVTLEPPVLIVADGQVAPDAPGFHVRAFAHSDVRHARIRRLCD